MNNVDERIRIDKNPDDLDEFGYFFVAVAVYRASRQKQRRDHALVLDVYVRATLHQQAHHVRVIILYRLM
jgi:hypothetical protein